MARRPRLFAPGVLYHVIVRGNHREKTFLNDGDYQAYIARLDRYRARFGVTICADPAVRLQTQGSGEVFGARSGDGKLAGGALLQSSG